MKMQEIQDFIKTFFERYYEKLYSTDDILVKLPGIPKEMLAEGANPDEEWNIWRLIPSTVTEKEMEELENECDLKFPNVIKVFLSTYYHFFEEPVGRNPVNKKFHGFKRAYNPHLTANNYLPFSWDKDNYFIRCIDLTNMPDEESCPVLEIDHEILFDMQYKAEDSGAVISKEDISRNMNFVAKNFYEYLNLVYDELDMI